MRYSLVALDIAGNTNTVSSFDLGYDYPETLAAFAPLVRVETVGIAIVALYGPPPAPPPLSPPGDGPDAGGAAQGIGEAILHPVAIAVIPTIHGDPPAAQFPPPGGGPDGAGGDALLFGVGLLPHGALPIIPGPDVPLGLPGSITPLPRPFYAYHALTQPRCRGDWVSP